MNQPLLLKDQLRLEALHRYDILDSLPEDDFDDLAKLAATLCETPIAIITLLDEKRQWFKSRLGLNISETPRAIAFCEHTLQKRELFMVENALIDERFQHNPLVTEDPHIRFYAGAPLISPEGYVLGTLSVIDRVPRQLNQEQTQALCSLSRHVVVLLELRKSIATLTRVVEERNAASRQLRQIQQELEVRVEERSKALQMANLALRSEVGERVAERNFSNEVINSLPGIFYLFDEQGKFLRWNDNFLSVTQYSAQELGTLTPLDFFQTDDDKRFIAGKIQHAFDTGHAQAEARLLTKDGRLIPHLFSAQRIRIGYQFCISGMGIDITQRMQYEQSLREAEERYRKLVDLSPEAIYVLKENRFVFANQAGFELAGASTFDDLRDRSVLDLIHPDSRPEVIERIRLLEEERTSVSRLEEKFIQLDGTVIDVEVDAAPYIDQGQPARLVVARDITESKRYKEQLEHQANYDALTQLANRNLLNDRIRQAIAYAERNHTFAIVAFIDLDNFKLINDSLGHDVGDQLLISLADCLKQSVREGDTVARHGGDEFVLVLCDHIDEEAIAAWMHRLIDNMAQPFTVGEHSLYVTCSIGLSIYPRDGQDAKTLLKHADAAMYQAKAEGRDRFKFFTPDMNERVRQRFSIEARLRHALERNELALYYQPQVDLASGKVTGIEALLRWMDPQAGMISPLTFIPIAEETGLIVPIGEWVLEHACEHNKQLQEAGLPDLTVSVNVSPRQFSPKALVKSVDKALRRANMEPQHLKLEVTESTLMNRPQEAREILKELKEMGVNLSIDDFGIGYSSLSYLQRFPMDQLKIDQSFVQRVADDQNDAAIAQAVITLGHTLNLKVVAEGVCTDEQLAFLRDNRCDEIQGNYFSQALPLDDLKHLLLVKQKELHL